MTTDSPYRAEFGAIHHKDLGGYLFTVSDANIGLRVACALNDSVKLAALRDPIREAIALFDRYALEHREKAETFAENLHPEAAAASRVKAETNEAIARKLKAAL